MPKIKIRLKDRQLSPDSPKRLEETFARFYQKIDFLTKQAWEIAKEYTKKADELKYQQLIQEFKTGPKF